MGSEKDPTFLTSLIAGGAAGLSVDIALFPLDTLKTRLQCGSGFRKAGGFRHLYKGIGAAAVGSIPSASLFFCTYDSVKKYLRPYVKEKYSPFLHMFAASTGELASCLIKVPVDIVKQRQQASPLDMSNLSIVRHAIRSEGILGMFRGFNSTVIREVPFSIIQLPLWEFFMKILRRQRRRDLNPVEVSLCGALSGGIAAASTTPLDVAKTRIMLAEFDTARPANRQSVRISRMLVTVYRENGVRGLFAGFVPRVMWITMGGAVFFGVYGAARNLCTKLQT